jgi:hypothetical protein
VPWASIGTRRFRLDQLDDALARAEVLEFPKALVTPNG